MELLAVLEEVQENEDENERSQLHTHAGGAAWSPRDEPLNEESHYRQEDPHEQAECNEGS